MKGLNSMSERIQVHKIDRCSTSATCDRQYTTTHLTQNHFLAETRAWYRYFLGLAP